MWSQHPSTHTNQDTLLSENVPHRRLRRIAEPFLIVVVFLLLLVSGYTSFQNTLRLRAHTDLVNHSFQIQDTLRQVEAMLVSAEAGQRGFVITGHETHLEPYQEATVSVDRMMSHLASLVEGEIEIVAGVKSLSLEVKKMLGDLKKGIELRRNNGFENSEVIVATDLGKQTMDGIRRQIEQLQRQQTDVIANREQKSATAYWRALATSLFATTTSLILVVGVIYLVQYNRHRAEKYASEIQAERDRLQASIVRSNQLEIDNRRMDTYMRNFLEQIEDYAIFAMDADCKAITWNRGVLNVLGFEEHEFVGNDVRQLIFTPEAIEMGIPDAEFMTAASEGRASDDRWMMRKGGHRFWASGISSAIKNERDQVIGFSKVMRDLTERKRDQDEMAELAAKLADADRRKNEFLATLGHELRNPLAAMKNAVQLMGMYDLPTDLSELQQTMARQVEQLVRLIDDLLDVSRIARGKIQLKKEVVDLRTIIRAAVEASNPYILEKKQHLTVKLCEQNAPAHVDPARMTQVVCNLLNNSSRYSDSGSNIDVELSIDLQVDKQGWAVIVVRDNGVGIARDRIDEIFQMFSQIHDSLHRGNAGLGIGLTLVKTLVEIHGGTVKAQSDGIGHGSTFTVRIPLSDKSAQATPIALEPDVTSVTRVFRVLVVEDMRALRTIMARLLVKLGHEVQVAQDGLEALEQLSLSVPDVILSDISMPGMTGYDLARKLRSNPKTANVYLVAMTGYGQGSDREQAHTSGFDEHMLKPVDISKLQNLFERLSNVERLRSNT